MRRALRYLAWTALVLPAGLLLLGAWSVLSTFQKLKAADPDWKPSAAVLLWARAWCTVYRVPFEFMLSILHNEGASTPREIRPAEEAAFDQAGQDVPTMVYPMGDLSIAKGPSVGAGQVLRVNVLRLWQSPAMFVVKPSPLDLARVGNERAALWVAVKIAREALDQAGGDLNEAARRYNGGAHYNSAAVSYAEKADAFREELLS